ncbi:hypothetical protein [Crateriforma spongiae]|uniref:hypothetical protein n=1 Tax=Crateriforma spongiae TaxID=2724528 RepID=UPI0039AF7EB4
MASFDCPKCDHTQTVSDSHIGKRTKCPKCGEQGIVTESATPNMHDLADSPLSENIVVLRQSGGPIRTPLSHSIVLNKESSLEREFITVIDKTLPAGLTGCYGITTVYEPETDYTSGQYVYASRFAVKALEEIRAFETRFLIFNVWGRHVQTLSAAEIADVSAGATRQCDSKWMLYDENEACEHYASIAYLATIRTASGQVLETNISPVLAEAKKFSSKFSADDLDPKPRSK